MCSKFTVQWSSKFYTLHQWQSLLPESRWTSSEIFSRFGLNVKIYFFDLKIIPCVRNLPLNGCIDFEHLISDNPYYQFQMNIFWKFQPNRPYNYEIDFIFDPKYFLVFEMRYIGAPSMFAVYAQVFPYPNCMVLLGFTVLYKYTNLVPKIRCLRVLYVTMANITVLTLVIHIIGIFIRYSLYEPESWHASLKIIVCKSESWPMANHGCLACDTFHW